MSLELQDCNTKVHPEVHALLKAHALINQMEMSALVRQIVHEWASKQERVWTMAQDLAKSKGLSGITGEWK